MINQKYCPCGGIILADSEDWETPVCNEHFEALGEPNKEPTGVPIRFLFSKEDTSDESVQPKVMPTDERSYGYLKNQKAEEVDARYLDCIGCDGTGFVDQGACIACYKRAYASKEPKQ